MLNRLNLINYPPEEIRADFICIELLEYNRHVKHEAILTEAITTWLYEHSAGIISVVISLVHDAEEIAVLSGKEVLNLDMLSEAYQKHLGLLHGYIEPAITKKAYTDVKKHPPRKQV